MTEVKDTIIFGLAKKKKCFKWEILKDFEGHLQLVQGVGGLANGDFGENISGRIGGNNGKKNGGKKDIKFLKVHRHFISKNLAITYAFCCHRKLSPCHIKIQDGTHNIIIIII